MTQRIPAAVAVALCASLLAGCATDSEQQANGPQRNFHRGRDPTADNAAGSGLSLFSFGGNQQSQQPGGMEVNAYLWRGALDALKFMPLAQADPFGGVIITDWWTPPTSPGERFKATAYILGRQLRADGIRVSLFRQVQQNGQWADAPVDPSKGTELENVVLSKARELRAQSASGS
jgi:Domain of unknown function (DUF3576)